MSSAAAGAVFASSVALTLGASWFLVSRIERVGSRFGASEALLGLVSALAADAPEITSAISALLAHQGTVGAGVAIGSNVFNLAALLGLGSIAAGVIHLHPRVVVFQGTVAAWVAVGCLLTVMRLLAPPLGLALVLVALFPYVAFAALHDSRRWNRPHPSAARRWLQRAIAEEELELSAAVHPRRGGARDAAVAAVALAVVVIASVAMERVAARLGVRFAVPGIIVGGIVLAAVTSLPNAVAAVYWAKRGRGIATLSTGLNSNALNVVAGFLLPAALLGLGRPSGDETLVAGWYAGLTAFVLVIAYAQRGLRRSVGCVIVGAYAAFTIALVLSA